MTKRSSKIFYATVMILFAPILGAMIVVEYRGTILPLWLLNSLLASIIGVVVCDRIWQYSIKRGLIE
jgi:hypothetical protein